MNSSCVPPLRHLWPEVPRTVLYLNSSSCAGLLVSSYLLVPSDLFNFYPHLVPVLVILSTCLFQLNGPFPFVVPFTPHFRGAACSSLFLGALLSLCFLFSCI